MNTAQPSHHTPKYGASGHYLGEAGEQYFAGQKVGGQIAALWNLPFWLPHVGAADSVLDFGCGGGYLLAALPSVRKVGVEINPTARHEAESHGLEVYPRLDDVPVKPFSRVISSHALEHVPAPLDALNAMERLLNPGGQLVLLLPLDDWRSAHHRQFKPNDPHFHLYSWTPQNIGNLLVEAGFVVKSVSVLTDAMPPLALARRVHGIPALRIAFGRLAGITLRRRQLLVRAGLESA